MKIEREELEKVLIPVLQDLSIQRRKVEQVKNYLSGHVFDGDTKDIINNPNLVKEVDLRLLCLLSQAIYDELSVEELNPEIYFTTAEIKDAGQYTGLLEYDENHSLLPLKLEDAVEIGNDSYMARLHVSTINNLLQAEVLFYNFDTQREAAYRRNKDTIIKVPKVNPRAVKEITNHLINGTLIQTVLVLNAAPGSSDEDEELVFNSKKNVLEITPGTRLDILDGYHRILGVKRALNKKPNIDFWFPVMITNFSTIKAQQYIGQISMATPISRAKAKSLSKSRYADEVVQYLRENSELKGRISDSESVHYINNEIVSVNVLADTIDECFKMEKKLDAIKVGEFLTEFFTLLFGSFEDEFINNVAQTRKESLINANIMFTGFLALASNYYEQNKKVTVSGLTNILNNIDFKRTNPLWNEIGIVDNKGSIVANNKSKKNLIKYFKDIDI